MYAELSVIFNKSLLSAKAWVPTNVTVDGIITTDDAISVFLDVYASKNYINYTKSKILKEHEKIRSDYIKDLSKSTLQNIEISYSSNEEE